MMIKLLLKSDFSTTATPEHTEATKKKGAIFLDDVAFEKTAQK
jgi:hypothetical protein